MSYIIFNIATGEIASIYQSGLDEHEQVKNQLLPGQAYIEGAVISAETSYVRKEGDEYVLASRPPRPSQFCRWVNEQWVEDEQQKLDFYSSVVRDQRNALLQESDWTDTASAPTRLGDDLYNQWQTYRQALRDITQQPGFPLNVIWPVPPA